MSAYEKRQVIRSSSIGSNVSDSQFGAATDIYGRTERKAIWTG
jgi:hypothetical protein